MDVDSSWFGSEESARFKKMNHDIFEVESQARKLGMEDVRLALYRARIELGYAEQRARDEFTLRVRRERGD